MQNKNESGSWFSLDENNGLAVDANGAVMRDRTWILLISICPVVICTSTRGISPRSTHKPCQRESNSKTCLYCQAQRMGWST